MSTVFIAVRGPQQTKSPLTTLCHGLASMARPASGSKQSLRDPAAEALYFGLPNMLDARPWAIDVSGFDIRPRDGRKGRVEYSSRYSLVTNRRIQASAVARCLTTTWVSRLGEFQSSHTPASVRTVLTVTSPPPVITARPSPSPPPAGHSAPKVEYTRLPFLRHSRQIHK